ncbi:hypothetical protein MNBD_GAMMA05-133 [hydrothermal vent metagenome]|uniref:CzcB-like C-terminal circularly permuted SH3-like domain-containing protein n=1 Tax=hydrothermal vent metagenome TaxID=652676 RepID=A0A3B0WSZ1_9ZZZZ
MITHCLSRSVLGVALSSVLFIAFVEAGVRDHTRAKRYASVSTLQATELTLTVVKVEKKMLQTWVRAAAKTDASKKKIVAMICTQEAGLIIKNQRVRAFTPSLKSSVYQLWVDEVSQNNECVRVVAMLPKKVFGKEQRYVMEILVHRGKYLSIPNEAIIEEEGQQIAYVQRHKGDYVPQIVYTGIKGELYTQILQGLDDGDEVVTFGSFFIDADYKLNKAGGGHAHHHH